MTVAPEKTRRLAGSLVITAVVCLAASGCHSARVVFHRPSASNVTIAPSPRLPAARTKAAAVSESQAVLLASLRDEPLDRPEPDGGQMTPDAKETEPPSETDADAEDDERSTPANAIVGYTAPGPAYRQLSLAIGAMTVGSVPDLEGTGREMAESIMFSSEGVSGRLGLTAPSPILAAGIASRPGLQEGPGTGLSFANPTDNLFTPRLNRLSGPDGRCNDLARAGFFGGSRSTCERSLGRQ